MIICSLITEQFFLILPNPCLTRNVCLKSLLIYLEDNLKSGGARGVMVIVVGNEHGDTSSNPGRDWLHFTLH